MRSYLAKLSGLQLYAMSRKFGSELLYRVEDDKGLKAGLFYKEFDGEGNETIRPLRSGRWIYNALAQKIPYIKERWEGGLK